MWSNAREIAAGDTVIIWLTRDQVQPLVVTPGKDFNTKFGNFRHADFVGVPYGSKVASRTGRGFIHILRPTPELWTIALPHRTQILYLADIAFISAHLGIKKGSKVIEAGTGSASFSHSVARTIGSSGHLYSYEFHEARFIKAKEEFARHGLSDLITLTHRNVCKDGFTVVDEVDSVFLDLPAPWDAVEHAKKALRKDRVTRICCFSPCMEQVLRTVNALNEAGFSEITMYETLLRPIEVFQTPPLPTIHDLPEKLRQSEAKREEKRQRQIKANKEAAEKKAARDAEKALAKKRKAEEDAMEGGEDEGVASKRVKTGEEEKEAEDVEMADGEPSTTPAPAPIPQPESASTSSTPAPGPSTSSTSSLPPTATIIPEASSFSPSSSSPSPSYAPPKRINVSKALPEVRGHTSYLTFAVLVPDLNKLAALTASASAAGSASTSVEANSTNRSSSNANAEEDEEEGEGNSSNLNSREKTGAENSNSAAPSSVPTNTSASAPGASEGTDA